MRSVFYLQNCREIGDLCLSSSQIATFLNDYKDALVRANQFDSSVSTDANKVSSDYASLVALSIRQTFGAIEITVPQRSDGSFDTSNVLTFMKRA